MCVLFLLFYTCVYLCLFSGVFSLSLFAQRKILQSSRFDVYFDLISSVTVVEGSTC